MGFNSGFKGLMVFREESFHVDNNMRPECRICSVSKMLILKLAVHHLPARLDGDTYAPCSFFQLHPYFLGGTIYLYLFISFVCPYFLLCYLHIFWSYFGRIHKDNSVRVMNYLMPE